ncbi:MAG: hypothetical protein P4M01_04265 [Acidobacteriota bacterium]|nr:hypothetical protein [Acidobacteriota bacterium]
MSFEGLALPAITGTNESSAPSGWIAAHRSYLFLFSLWLIAGGVLLALIATADPNFAAGWDARVYRGAVTAAHQTGDPYAKALSVQADFQTVHHHRGDHFPMTYVYGPVTVPLIRALGRVPEWLLASIYGMLLVLGYSLLLYAGWQMAHEEERKWLRYVLPFAVFFPGLLASDIILSGNIVYVLYGPIMAAAVRGVRRGKWFCFFAAVLVAGILKPPLLTLLAIAVAGGKKQWVPASVTGALGVAGYALQQYFWPALFAEYLLAVRLQFDWNADFGFGPAGLLGQALYEAHKPLDTAPVVLYLVFAAIVLAVMLLVKQRVTSHAVPWQDWLPLAILGAFLLNPRIKEYDVAAITLPMLLLAWRMSSAVVRLGRGRQQEAFGGNWPEPALIFAFGGWFVAFNMIATQVDWHPTAFGILFGLFVMGAVWLRFTKAFAARQTPVEQIETGSVSGILVKSF